MTSSDAPSAEVEWYWRGSREMPQEAHAGEKKRKLWRDHQAKATAKKVIILGRTFDVLSSLSMTSKLQEKILPSKN